MNIPKCFENDEQFILWIKSDDGARGHYRAVNKTPICNDCTAAYAASMRLAGRCEHPEVRFERNAEGEMVGAGYVKSESDATESCEVEARRIPRPYNRTLLTWAKA